MPKSEGNARKGKWREEAAGASTTRAVGDEVPPAAIGAAQDSCHDQNDAAAVVAADKMSALTVRAAEMSSDVTKDWEKSPTLGEASPADAGSMAVMAMPIEPPNGPTTNSQAREIWTLIASW